MANKVSLMSKASYIRISSPLDFIYEIQLLLQSPNVEDITEVLEYTELQFLRTQSYGDKCFKKSQEWKILKISTHPTSPYVLVNSIIYIENSQHFYSSCSMRHSPWRADEWIFPALSHINIRKQTALLEKH